MSDRIKKIKVKKADGSMTDYIPIGVDAENVDFDNGYKLDNIVGSINPDESGSIAAQLSKSIKYYDCVADMKADTTLNGGGAARTLGYYEPGDGGGAIYEIINDSDVRYSTSTDDGGSVHDLDNENKALLNIENDSIDIAQYGAKYGDRSFNSSTALQKAINKFDNIVINGDIYLGHKITITKNYQSIIQNAGKIYPIFNNDDVFRITGWSDTLKVTIDGTYQQKPELTNTTNSAIFVGDGGSLSAEKGRNFKCDWTEVTNFYGNGIKHVNGAFGSYYHTWVNHCYGHGFYFPAGCTDNQLHYLAFTHSVNNKGIGYYITTQTEDTYTHDNDGILVPSSFTFNVAKAFGNNQNFKVECGKHYGSVYSETTRGEHDYWACSRSEINYYAAEEANSFTDAGADNVFTIVDSWHHLVKLKQSIKDLTITTNRIGEQHFTQENNNEFIDRVVGDKVNSIYVKHTYSDATDRQDEFKKILLGDTTSLDPKINKIIDNMTGTLSSGATKRIEGGSVWLGTSTIPKIFVTALTESNQHVSVTAHFSGRGSSGWTPSNIEITNTGTTDIDLSTIKIYFVVFV